MEYIVWYYVVFMRYMIPILDLNDIWSWYYIQIIYDAYLANLGPSFFDTVTWLDGIVWYRVYYLWDIRWDISVYDLWDRLYDDDDEDDDYNDDDESDGGGEWQILTIGCH